MSLYRMISRAFSGFLDGQESIHDETCSRCPKIVTSNQVTVINPFLNSEF